MTSTPAIFISATSDLRSARDLVGKVLYSMGYEPVWQEIAATEGGELLEILRQRIAPCAIVLQLVGQRYGAEPPQPTPDFGRVSYTQYEALYAEKVGKKRIYHIVDSAYPTDPASLEPPELIELQSKYKQRLVETNRLRHGNITSQQDLELSIRRIRDELAEIRTQADRRFRRGLWLTAAALAGVALVAGLVMLILHRQTKSDVMAAQSSAAVTDQLAAMREALRAAVAPKPLAAGEKAPPPLSPELIAKAKILLDRGNAEDQALAKIALKQHDEANRIIQDLKSKPGNPIDEAFRLLTLEGDNWYQAGKPDKAIEPYEQAMALKPTDFAARKNVVIAHVLARQGDIAAHCRRAIAVAEGTLNLVAPQSVDWAKMQNDLAIAWSDMPTGNRGENLRKAVAAFELALTVRTKDADPSGWAATQNNLGAAWFGIPTGDRGENLRKAITAYELALTIRTKDANPSGWAKTQYNLAIAWSDMPTGDRGENLRKAVAASDLALTVFTKEADPSDWAATQNNLGNAWSDMPTGDGGENLQKAIAAYELALTVFTKDADPSRWAMTQDNLGATWCDMPTGDRSENLRKAISAFESALTIYTKDTHPTDWARTQYNMGIALARLADAPGNDRRACLARAIASDKAALLVYTSDAFPVEHAQAQRNLEQDQRAYESTGGAATRPVEAIAPDP